jgi:hypothetical protein
VTTARSVRRGKRRRKRKGERVRDYCRWDDEGAVSGEEE